MDCILKEKEINKMENYNEYLEERLIGMQNLIESSNNPLLEGFKKNKLSEEDKKHAKLCKDAFLNYLEYKYNDEDVRYEIKSAKSNKDREKVAKKYAKDFEDWKKHNNKINLSFIGMMFSAGAGAATGAPIWLILYFVFFGVILSTSKKLDDQRDAVGVEKYNAKNKK
jgi:hypothetical protein